MASKQIKIGIVMTYGMGVLQIVVNLLFTGVLVRYLGEVEYGLYLLLGSLAATIAVFDFGMNNTVSRYIAKYRVENDRVKESNLVSITTAIYCMISLLVIFAGMIVRGQLHRFINDITPENLVLAKQLFTLLIVNVAITLPMNSFVAILVGYERFIVTRTVSMLRILVMPLISIPFLMAGYGAVAVVTVTTAANLAAGIANALYVFKKVGVRLKLYYLNWSTVKELVVYSGFVFLTVVADQLYYYCGNIVLGMVSDPVSVSVFGTAWQLTQYMTSVVAAFTGVFLASATQLVLSNPGSEKLTDFFSGISRVVTMLLALILGGFWAIGREFVSYWLLESYGDVYWVACIILTSTAWMLAKAGGLSVLQAKNMHGFRAKVLLVNALANYLLCFLVAGRFGYWGVAACYFVTTVIASIVLDVYYIKKVELDMKRFYWGILPIVCVMLACSAVVTATYVVFPGYSYANLILRGCLYVALFLALLYAFCLQDGEKKAVTALFRRLSPKRNAA